MKNFLYLSVLLFVSLLRADVFPTGGGTDGTFSLPGSAGAGSGDVVGPSSSVDGEIVLFDLTTGKLVKSATGTGLVKATSGVYSAATLVNADVSASAAIAWAKMAALTASRVMVTDGSGNASASSVTATTLGYLDATSSIQTQLDAKGDLFGPASSTDEAVCRFDTTTGKLTQSSAVTLTDAGAFLLPAIAAPAAVANKLHFWFNGTSKRLMGNYDDGGTVTMTHVVNAEASPSSTDYEIPRMRGTGGDRIVGGSNVVVTTFGGYSDMHYAGDSSNYLEFYPAGDGLGFGKNLYGNASYHFGKAGANTATWASGNIGSWFIGTTGGTYKTPVSALEIYEDTTATANRISLTSVDLGRTSTDGAYIEMDATGNVEIKAQESSKNITLTPGSGGTVRATGLVEDLHGLIATVADATYPIVAKNRVARQVTKFAAKCGSGSVTAKLQIGGSDITTCTAMSITTTISDTTCSTGASNDLASGGRLTLVTSSNSSCTDFEWSIETTRD